MRTRVDALLGRVTMYRLMVIVLALLAAIALAYSAFGDLAYTPGALLAGLGVLLVVTYVSNRLFAALFGVTAHGESALITALLLFFILQPTTDLLTLGQIALAGLFASASKYLLAFRGRHIFNPAAVGALWLTVSHIYLAFWWVGTPVLLPFTAALALIVLYRTRRLPMAAVFVVVAGAILFSRNVGDAGVSAALSLTFAQSPLIFFVGFMLSEPLTLPPRLREQLGLAALVGLLFALPISSIGIEFGPEAALVVGNLVAFGFGQRRAIDLVLTGKRPVTGSATEFTFRPTRKVAFTAGQYLELTVPHRRADSRGVRRSFSLTSAPRDTEMRIALKIPERPSSFKRALTDLEVGSTVAATGISGDFLLPADPSVPLLLVAGGIGITPFASQLAELSDAPARDIVVVYLVSDSSEVAYADVLELSRARVVIVTRTRAPQPVGSPRQRSTPSWDFEESVRPSFGPAELADLVPDVARRKVYVSGPPAVVTTVAAAARKLGARRVHRDYFSGY